jgi:hypothetical protein
METVYADFNNQDERGRIRLNCVGSLQDLERLQPMLRNRLTLRLTDGEGCVVATLYNDQQANIWLGVPDWDTWEEVDSPL